LNPLKTSRTNILYETTKLIVVSPQRRERREGVGMYIANKTEARIYRRQLTLVQAGVFCLHPSMFCSILELNKHSSVNSVMACPHITSRESLPSPMEGSYY